MPVTYKGNHLAGEIEIYKEVKIFENDYVTHFNDEVIFPGGTKGKYLRTEWKAPYGVMIAPICDDNKLLLVKNFRHQKRGWTWELVKGFGEEHLLPHECANKELEEETGYRSHLIQPLKKFHDQGLTTTLFLGVALSSLSETNLEEGEAIEQSKFFTKEEAMKLISDDECDDPITMFVISMFSSGHFDR